MLMFQHTLQQEFEKTTNHSRRITLSEVIKWTKTCPVDKREVGRTLGLSLSYSLALPRNEHRMFYRCYQMPQGLIKSSGSQLSLPLGGAAIFRMWKDQCKSTVHTDTDVCLFKIVRNFHCFLLCIYWDETFYSLTLPYRSQNLIFIFQLWSLGKFGFRSNQTCMFFLYWFDQNYLANYRPTVLCVCVSFHFSLCGLVHFYYGLRHVWQLSE